MAPFSDDDRKVIRAGPAGLTQPAGRSWRTAADYALACGLTAAMLGLCMLSQPLFGGTGQLLLFPFAIMISAYRGGLGPGLLATALAVPAAAYFLLEPVSSLGVTAPADQTRLLLLTFLGVMISALCQGLRWTRRRAEQSAGELRRANQRLSDTLESIADGVVTVDRSFTITSLNAAAVQIIGRPAESLVGHNLWEAFPAARGTRFQHEYERALREDRTVHFEELFAPMAIWFEVHAYPSRTGLSLYFRDVTARRQGEDALRTSGQRLELLAEVSGRLLASREPERELDGLCRRVMQFLECDVYLNYLLHEPGGRLWLNACGGLTPDQAQRMEVLEPGQGLAGAVVTEERSAVLEDLGASPDPRAEVLRPLGLKVCACELLAARGRVMGTLCFGSRTRRRFTREELSLQRGVAAEMSIALERVRSREELARSEERFRTLAETIPQIVWSAGADGAVDYYNTRWVEYTGLSPARGAGSGWEEVLHPDDEDATRAAWSEAVRTGRPYEIEHRLRGRDGQYRWHLSRSMPLRDARGGIAGWIGSATDVHDLRQAQEALRESERRLKLAAEGAQVGLWFWDLPDGRFVATRLCHRLFGVSEHADLSYGQLISAVHPDDRARVEAVIRHSHLTGGEFRVELRTVLPEGSLRWIALQGHTALGAGQQPLRMSGIALDMTDRKQLELERDQLLEAERAARSEAERQGRLKDEFVATLSHELRTPLTAVLGWGHMLERGHLNPAETHEAIDTIVRNAEAQKRLIEDLLDMSRIISGKIRLDVQRIDLARVVDAALGAVRPAAEAKGVALERSVEPECCAVIGDATRLQQVLLNLLSNAVKFTPRGGRVRVCMRSALERIRVQVIDTGAGFEPEFVPHLFERFRQADATTTRKARGLGLGLAIVKQLIELHGGTVRASSPGAGHGATFEFELPQVGRTSELELPVPRSPAWPIPAEAVQLRDVAVLVVEDEQDTREMLRRLFLEHHARVEVASSAAEALDHIERNPPDVLVSDISMPGEDGYSLLRKVRSSSQPRVAHVPAVAVTAFARDEDRERARAAGYEFHLSKPVNPAELTAVVARLAGRAA